MVKIIMFSAFARFFAPSQAPKGDVKAMYQRLVTQAREPYFYTHLGVNDTVEGRFELIYLHLFMFFHRLRHEKTPLKQEVFDYFLELTDANLREMSVGDLKVPKLMKAVGQNFYGRLKAYSTALSSPEELTQALHKNIYKTNEPIENAALLSNYVLSCLQKLDETPTLNLTQFVFPKPNA
jgi:cytochrome b pre-mRNA-processing protein 3